MDSEDFLVSVTPKPKSEGKERQEEWPAEICECDDQEA